MSSTEQWQAAYLDVGHGVGVTDGGRFFRCRPGARLGEVLAAVPGGVRRLYLCSELPHLDGDVASDDPMGAADHGDDAAAGDAVSACGEDDAGVWDDPVPAGGALSAYLQWCLDDPG
ncbi:MAG TPA: hypothetical protein VGS80_12440, partial [Ktedonobacterales bacterium]|nr:hypothetical protein [Ktedonobacterales bacterium]